mgnify:CR=1 FL=1|tara:strand:- start:8368 stop:9852 length:1485 start_codon:yes stop_codon:yes gene_type:complete
MKFSPSNEEFIELSNNFDVIAVEAKFTADAETPLSAYHKISGNKPAFLFESVVGGEQVSRFSFVGCDPRKIISCKQSETTIIDRKSKSRSIQTPKDPLKLIEEEMDGIRYHGLSGDNRFSGGAVGYISYEYASRIEESIPLPEKDELGLPFLFFVVADLILIFDHACQTLTICANAYCKDNAENAYREACLKIEKISELLSSPHKFVSTPLIEYEPGKDPTGNFSREEFERLVEKTKEFVKAGDIIQAVLSQRFSLPFEGDPTSLYRAIRAINPSPYMFLLESDDFAIVGASPEVHVRLTNDDVMIRPIAGTRPRGKDKEEDLLLEKELLKDEKEKAEHLMLVDLARNDIGRVCQSGTVRAAEFMTVEKYSHVMHIVSQVIGKLRTGQNAFDLMRATFPAGTVSGAPKVRAMQIISEFENLQRNAYAGALGYFGFEGNHDSCIAIRTAMITQGQIHLQSGAGIVADSNPSDEYQETLNKAKGMLKALAMAEQML